MLRATAKKQTRQAMSSNATSPSTAPTAIRAVLVCWLGDAVWLLEMPVTWWAGSRGGGRLGGEASLLDAGGLHGGLDSGGSGCAVDGGGLRGGGDGSGGSGLGGGGGGGSGLAGERGGGAGGGNAEPRTSSIAHCRRQAASR